MLALTEAGCYPLVPQATHLRKLLARCLVGAGLTHAGLLRLCQDKFLVSNDVTLRSHLTEFRDHELLQTRWACSSSADKTGYCSPMTACTPPECRRVADGSEVLFIPVDNNTLKQLLSAGQVD